MKRAYVAAVAIVAVFLVVGMFYYSLSKSVSTLQDSIHRMEQASAYGDNEQVTEISKELLTFWRERETFIGLMVEHSQIDSINVSIVQLERLAELDSEIGLLLELSELMAELEHLLELQKIRLGSFI